MQGVEEEEIGCHRVTVRRLITLKSSGQSAGTVAHGTVFIDLPHPRAGAVSQGAPFVHVAHQRARAVADPAFGIDAPNGRSGTVPHGTPVEAPKVCPGPVPERPVLVDATHSRPGAVADGEGAGFLEGIPRVGAPAEGHSQHCDANGCNSAHGFTWSLGGTAVAVILPETSFPPSTRCAVGGFS